ncbi:MAG: TonB-dependent receptor [Deltaproteobacteria bacterium]|nr:TonB-dependent receptor [Deltaproteobacteria bacterium]
MIRPRAAAFCLLVLASPAFAEDAEPADGGTDAALVEDLPIYETIVTAGRPPTPRLDEERARSRVTRDDMERRLPRSAPDALRYEPGVFVQQTAHGQGSAFIRGLTGQQTLLLFDGIRLNNGTYRQGPNQYFFTLDSQTIDSIEVERGGASTRWGSDALGGAILAMPIEPAPRAPGATDLATWDPHLVLRAASADEEEGGRLATNLTLGEPFAFYGGFGGRNVGLLESGGPVRGLSSGEPAMVPRFADDGRTQLGTGFDELTADGRALYRISSAQRATVAAYAYREYDAPRTDQCPAAYAPWDECLRYDEQFRTLVYGAWEGEPHLAGLDGFRATLSWQNQRERRTRERPSSGVENIGRDMVDTVGVTVAARTQRAAAARWLGFTFDYGVDTYHDMVSSASWITFTDVGYTRELDRGQYVDGSRYTYGGAFLDLSADLLERFVLRGGGRVSWIAARAPAVPETGGDGVSRAWAPVVGHAGLEVKAAKWLSLLGNYDRSFRAPNLDDLTARQQTGPGFQFENPKLEPETADTYEVGARVTGKVTAELWLFRTLIDGAVVKRPMSVADCPPDTPQCESSWTRLMLVNADDVSEIHGVEAYLGAFLPAGFETRLTAAWTWGEGPNMGDPPSDPSLPYDERVPLSRIPPLNGTVELLWRHAGGLSAGASLRWAAAQDRLAIADLSDARIPEGGTPGFAVMDLRAGYRRGDLFLLSIALENVFDSAYRYHGSAVNGPARGLVLLLDLGPIWRL